eukprot:6462654-Amphidinium_carterae.1
MPFILGEIHGGVSGRSTFDVAAIATSKWSHATYSHEPWGNSLWIVRSASTLSRTLCSSVWLPPGFASIKLQALQPLWSSFSGS